MEKSSKLSILADNTLASIYERNRCRAEDIEYPHEETLDKNMEKLRFGIKELEEELSAAEESGTLYVQCNFIYTLIYLFNQNSLFAFTLIKLFEN